ncbi:unnamed protein product [Echinostoma caproni]|uniref:Uncharacterized protein n=1 Tax=Echinostoma caproni TaxID=27848 RepID=A0A183BCX0_9TREM|nr:unnamed protein product [Echinostoma caproni]
MLMLFNEKETLQNDLNKKRLSKMGLSDNADFTEEANEIRRLLQLVRNQEDEIDRITKELGLSSSLTVQSTEDDSRLHQKR